VVSKDKPAAAQITQGTEIGEGFVLKTLAASGDDRLIATAADGRLLAYTVTGPGKWSGAELDDDGWQAFTHLVSPGGGLYYGRTSDGAMYWYEDDDPTNGKGSDIGYHLNDPVTSRGWTQELLSAQPAMCGVKPTVNPIRATIAELALREVGTPGSQCDQYHSDCKNSQPAWCAMFATWTWEKAGVSGVPRGQKVARGLGQWGKARDLFKRRPDGAMGSPKVGDFVIWGEPDGHVGGHVDVVVAVQPNSITIVGGNVDNKVTKRRIDPRKADSSGRHISGYVSPPGA
jgi:hypothetical protein